MVEKDTFHSSLTQIPLPEIMITIEHFKVPGRLTITHGGIEKKIFFEDKFVTFAASNVDDDRLGEFLIREGKIKQIDYDNSVELLKKTNKRQGQIFVDLGCLTPQELFWAVKAQVKEIVLSLFLWTDGEVKFTPGDFVKEEKIKLRAHIREIILEGIKRIQNPRRLVSYIGGKDMPITVAPDALERMEKVDLGPEYYDVYNLVDGKKTCEQLATESTRSNAETVRVLYTLIVFGALKRATDTK